MNLYLISQSIDRGYDTYDSAVVAAEGEQAARETLPDNNSEWRTYELDEDGFWVDEDGDNPTDWAENVSQVSVKYLGQAAEGTPSGVILASFNAG